MRAGLPGLPDRAQELKFATVVADLAADESFEAVQEDYQLTREQVIAALRYAAHLAAHTPPAVSEAS